MLVLLFLLSFFFFVGNGQVTQQFSVSVTVFNNGAPPALPVLVFENVSTTTNCCLSGATCKTGTNPFILNSFATVPIVWYGCYESSTLIDPVACLIDNDFTTQFLISISSSSLGNCSISGYRISYIATSPTFPYNTYCAYSWGRTIRTCGNLYCSWNNNNLITIECTQPVCSPSSNVNHCNLPWNPTFDPSYYT